MAENEVKELSAEESMIEFANEFTEVLRMHFLTNIEKNKTKGRNLQIWEEQAHNVFSKIRNTVRPDEEMDALIKRLRMKNGGY